MRNPEITREKILYQSGNLFNTKGYKATSLSDITDATGLTKGAIYRHFKNKDELEMATLTYLSGVMFSEMRTLIKEKTSAQDKLRATFKYFENYVINPKITGGCPLMNAAIESDDSLPLLRQRSIEILNLLQNSIENIIEKGKKYGQIKPETDSILYSSLIIASLEGAIMMSKLRGNQEDIKRINTYLEKVLDDISCY